MAMQSITTKYIGPRNVRGARIKATTTTGLSVTIPYDHALGLDENHEKAVQALARKLKWTGRMVAGGAMGGGGNVYVFMPHDPKEIIRLHGDIRRSSGRSRGGRSRRR
jgi:hypothetical protein